MIKIQVGYLSLQRSEQYKSHHDPPHHPSSLHTHSLSVSHTHTHTLSLGSGGNSGVSTDTVVDLPTATDICITIADQPPHTQFYHCSKAGADVLYLIPYTFYLASVLCHHRRRCCYIITNNNYFIKKFPELWCIMFIYRYLYNYTFVLYIKISNNAI